MKQTFNQYMGRAVRHLVRLTVLVGLIFGVMYATNTLAIEPADLLGTRGIILLVAIVLISAAYPLYGFSTASVRASMTEDREQIVEALLRGGYTLSFEREGEMLFRASSGLKRLVQLGDDAVVVRQTDDHNLTVSGQRKEVENARFRITGYINAKK